MTIQAVLLLALGLLIGAALARANFCFVYLTRATTQGDLTPLVAGFAAIASGTIVFYLTGQYGMHKPAPWAWPSLLTILGGIAFGLGARLNGACAVGTIGRLLQGDLGGLVTLAGGFLAAFVAPTIEMPIERPEWAGAAQSIWVFVAIGLTVLLAVIAIVLRRGSLELTIGAVLLGGAAALANTARGQTSFVGLTDNFVASSRSLTFAAFCIGFLAIAAVGAASLFGRLQIQPPRFDRMFLEFFGGALMGAGALAIPGTSDVLAFYGVPSGSPHAIVALFVIFATVAGSFVVTESHFWREKIAPRLSWLFSDHADTAS